MPPITIQAGNSRRLIAVLNATDKDEDDRIRYMTVMMMMIVMMMMVLVMMMML